MSQIRTLSLISFVIMMFILARFLTPFEREFPGLIQRVFYLGWSVWYVSLALGFIDILNKKERFYR